MQTAAPAGILFGGIRHLQRMSTPREVCLSCLQLVPQSFPDQPAAGELGRPQDVPRVRAGSLALQMHGLQRVQTSQGIQPFAERPRNGFPHPLQDLRDVHRVQASLLRPSVHDPGQQNVYTVLRAIPTQGMWDMQQDAGEEEIPCFSMEGGVKDHGSSQLVPPLLRMPHLHKMQRQQEFRGFRASILRVQAVQRDEDMHSLRPATGTKCVSSIAMETRRKSNAELDSTLHSVPLLRDVQPDQKCTGLRPESNRLHRLPTTH